MKVYEAANGQWIFFNNGQKTYYNTQRETLDMADKVQYAESIQTFSTKLAQLFLEASDLEAIYSDRSYGDGSVPIVDSDIESTGATAAQVSSFITMIQQLGNFANNRAVVTGDYSATVNALRTDK